MDYSYYKIGNFNISNLCFETYPCKHHVKIDDSNEGTMMYGDDIYCMLAQNGFHDKHFECYKNNEDYEDTEINIKDFIKTEKIIKENKKTLEKRVLETNRIEKLKQKNNIVK